MTEVIMPKMGDGMEEGTLLEWLKKDGEEVKSGEVIGTIQTDKATLELEAPRSGTLSGIIVPAGSAVPVGKPMAVILGKGESIPASWSGGSNAPVSEGSKAEAPKVEAAPVEAPKAEAPTAQSAPSPVASTNGSGRVIASPLARKIAREKGIDLTNVTGTGPGGRIVEKDVASAKPAAPAAVSAPITVRGEDKKVPLTRLRKITAERTAQSKQQVPHYYVTVEVDVERLMNLRATFEEEGAGKVSVNDFIVRASVLALIEMPGVNASFQADGIIEYASVNIGIAAAVEDGLTVAVLRDAQNYGLREINRRSHDLVQRARENKLTLDELSNSTFSISNMGMLDVDNFSAIISQPNAAILAVSSVRKKPVVNDDDELEVRRRMNITASFDHRVVDGATGAKFANLIRGYLENPTRLLS